MTTRSVPPEVRFPPVICATFAPTLGVTRMPPVVMVFVPAVMALVLTAMTGWVRRCANLAGQADAMARVPDLIEFCGTHGMKMLTVAELIRYRMANERYVHRVGEALVDTRYGEFRLIA